MSLFYTRDHRNDLLKQSTGERKCNCLRGNVKLTDHFGPWDLQSLALEVPKGQEHICDGNFVLSEIRCGKTTSKCPSKKPGDDISQGYLGRANKARRLRFRHFESVQEHLKYYRENKPNALQCTEVADQCERKEDGGESVCQCRMKSPARSTGKKEAPVPTCKCTDHHHLYYHPCPFPLRATGKAIVPACASLIMRLPSVQVSSDSFWVPVNAVFQSSQSGVQQDLCQWYDQQKTNPSDSDRRDREELPSLNNYKASSTTRSSSDGFPPSKAKRSPKSSRSTRKSLQYNSRSKTAENLDSDAVSKQQGEEAECTHHCHHHRTQIVTATPHRSYTGPGRLLSGKLRGTSCTHVPTQQDKLQDLAIGSQRSPYDKIVSNQTASAQAKHSIQELYTSTGTGPRYSVDTHSTLRRGWSKLPDVDQMVSPSCERPTSPESQGLPINKLHITRENSEQEGLLPGTAIYCGPSSWSKLSTGEAGPDDKSNEQNQNKLYEEFFQQPKSMEISFAKPRKLFRIKSLQRRLTQHACSEDRKSTKNHKRKVTRDCRSSTACKNMSYLLQDTTRHRLALNHPENGTRGEGVFGARNQPQRTSCVSRSQERRKLKLQSASCSRQRENKEKSCNRNLKCENGERRVQVYLIKTTKPLEDLLPGFKTSKLYHQQNESELYGE